MMVLNMIQMRAGVHLFNLGMMYMIPVCTNCCSSNVSAKTEIVWYADKGGWYPKDLSEVYEVFCNDCDTTGFPDWVDTEEAPHEVAYP